MNSSTQEESSDAIAVIGMAGRFPGARNLDEFWQNLRNGVESVTFFSDEELRARGVPQEVLDNPSFVKAATILEDGDKFDARFFDYTPREAEATDPQHRVFMECAWEALEHAGYDAERYEGAIGVYAGASMSSYILGLYTHPDVLQGFDFLQLMIGTDKDFVPTKVSYKMNLTGPSINVQTACSTSLVAANLACQSLVDYQCDIALAGGVSLSCEPKTGYFHQQGGIMSPDGHCRTFDAKGAGTFAGQGVGIVVLKRLEDALADGDTIHAVIKGWALNNDGSLKVGYTAPSVDGQAQVIAEAQSMAQFPPETITYIEAHGTATNLGDPIEIAALTQAFRAGTEARGYCAIGSVKSNLGHCDAAAGIVGLLKTILCLKHKEIPPSLNFEEPNPRCNFETSPFYVNTELRDWVVDGMPRRAGVSSFGIGGTNAHMVLEEAPPLPATDRSRPVQVLTLSAKSVGGLDAMSARLADYLVTNSDSNLDDIAYTLQLGRHAFGQRRAVVCRDVDGAVEALRTSDRRYVVDGVQDVQERPVSFMFTGQGSQYVGMAAELYASEPVFRDQVDACAQLLEPHLGVDVRTVWLTDEEEAAERLQQTAMTQPALFVLEYALARLWESWGIRPKAMIGHSVGEYVAACLAGVFSLEDALALVATRGRLMQSLPRGSMLAVSLPEDKLRSRISEELDLAAVNGPEACVVSGPDEAVSVLERALEAEQVDCRRLRTSHAFHSAMMDPIVDEFAAYVGTLSLQPPSIPFVSNVSGTWITAEQACDPAYWAGHLRQPVRFLAGLETLAHDPLTVLLEVGPGHTLSRLAEMVVDEKRTVATSLQDRRYLQSDLESVAVALGKLWTVGVKVDWAAFQAPKRRRVPLPTYPFQREKYLLLPGDETSISAQAVPASTVRTMDDWVSLPDWRRAPAPPAPEDAVDGPVMVFLDEAGLGARLARRLAEYEEDVLTVTAGQQFERVADSEYVMSPESRDHYDLLVQDLLAREKRPRRIVHAWSVDDTQRHSHPFEAAQQKGFYSLLSLAQSLVKHNITSPLDVLVLSTGMQAVGPEDVSEPEKSTLLGPCKVIPQEHPNIVCRSVDVVAAEPGTWHESVLLDQLVAELHAAPSDRVVALRGHDRFVQTFEPAPPPLDGGNGVLREGGVYLITGGLGGLGLVFSEFLARTRQAKLALVARTPLPPREEWDEWLVRHPDGDPVGARIQIVRYIEALGSEVLILSADVADRAQMEGVLQAIDDRFGVLHGVIHAAGTVTGPSIRTIQEIAPEDSELQFGPKGRGLYVLESVLADRNLDFCLLMSSLSAVLGGLQFVAYAAANNFMDAFTQHHNRHHRVPWISVDWDGWRPEEMGEQAPGMGAQLAQAGLTPSQGMQVFERLLKLGRVPQAVVSVQDLSKRLEQWVSQEDVVSEGRRETGARLHPRPQLSTVYVAPRNDVEATIAEIWKNLLGIAEIGVNDDFFELGGHSLLGVRVMTRVREMFFVQLPLNILFDGPTIAHMAEAVIAQQVEQTDDETLSQLLEELGELSEEEALALLQEEAGGSGAGSE